MKQVPQELRKPNGELTKDVIEELQIFEDYYSELYGVKTDPHYSKDFFQLSGLPLQLTMDHRTSLEDPITGQEISKAIDSLKATKSPGLDGLTAEFYLKKLKTS